VPELRITQEDEKRVVESCGVYHRWLIASGFELVELRTGKHGFEWREAEKDFAVYRDFTGCQVFLSLERFGGWAVSQEKGIYIFGAGFDELCMLTAPIQRQEPFQWRA
jgi:hypothetical protein